MRSTARQPADDPAPARETLEARAGRALEEHAVLFAEIRAVHAEIRDALHLVPAAACDQSLARTLIGRLEANAERQRQLVVMADANSLHLEEARGAMAEFTAANAGNALLLASLRAREKALEETTRQVPPQRRGGGGGHARQTVLMRVIDGGRKAVVPVVAAFWAAAKPARHALGHPATWKLTAHTVKVATGAAAGAGTAAAVTVIALSPAVSHAASGSDPGSSATVPGWRTSATPFPSSSPAALLTKPKAKHAAKGRTLLSASGVPAPAAGPQTGSAPSAPPSLPAVQVSGTLAVTSGNTQLSLGLDGLTYSGSVTVMAQGGDVKWGATSNSPDVTVSTPDGLSGILGDGSAETFTISVDPSAQLSAGSATVRIWPGITISVTWIALPVVPAVSAAPSPSVSVPVSVPAPVLPGVLPG